MGPPPTHHTAPPYQAHHTMPENGTNIAIDTLYAASANERKGISTACEENTAKSRHSGDAERMRPRPSRSTSMLMPLSCSTTVLYARLANERVLLAPVAKHHIQYECTSPSGVIAYQPLVSSTIAPYIVWMSSNLPVWNPPVDRTAPPYCTLITCLRALISRSTPYTTPPLTS